MVVAQLDRDAALVLAPTAAVVWEALAMWRSSTELEGVLAQQYPQIDPAERRDALAHILTLLDEAELLEPPR